MSDVDLHELVNLPGAGAARSKLQEVGAWDAYAASGEPRAFTFLVTATYRVCEQVVVEARCREEAEVKAEKKFDDTPIRVGTIFGSDCDGIEVEDV